LLEQRHHLLEETHADPGWQTARDHKPTVFPDELPQFALEAPHLRERWLKPREIDVRRLTARFVDDLDARSCFPGNADELIRNAGGFEVFLEDRLVRTSQKTSGNTRNAVLAKQ